MPRLIWARSWIAFAAIPIAGVVSCATESPSPTSEVSGAPLGTVTESPATPAASAFSNSVGMNFVRVPPGTDAASFMIGQTEVTLDQWSTVMGFDPYTLNRSNPYYDLPGMAERINRPTNPATVSWHDAMDFVAALNQRENTTRYRLPTEAEWEFMARAGTTTTYSFGDDQAQLGEYAWYGEDFAAGSTHPVGQKRPNPWGLFDVHGNVWEWTADSYDADPDQKIVRGGSWHSSAEGWDSAIRKGYPADYRGISIGFRVVAAAL